MQIIDATQVMHEDAGYEDRLDAIAQHMQIAVQRIVRKARVTVRGAMMFRIDVPKLSDMYKLESAVAQLCAAMAQHRPEIDWRIRNYAA